MARKSKSTVCVEAEIVEDDIHSWYEFKNGFASIALAEKWIRDNICKYGHIRLRAVRVSGIFSKQVKIIKR